MVQPSQLERVPESVFLILGTQYVPPKFVKQNSPQFMLWTQTVKMPTEKVCERFQ
jgi:hypothetical protein